MNMEYQYGLPYSNHLYLPIESRLTVKFISWLSPDPIGFDELWQCLGAMTSAPSWKGRLNIALGGACDFLTIRGMIAETRKIQKKEEYKLEIRLLHSLRPTEELGLLWFLVSFFPEGKALLYSVQPVAGLWTPMEFPGTGISGWLLVFHSIRKAIIDSCSVDLRSCSIHLGFSQAQCSRLYRIHLN